MSLIPVSICMLTLFVVVLVRGSKIERMLRSDIFENYSKDLRPVEYEEYPVNVTLDLTLFQIIRLNEKEQTFEISAWLRQRWQDTQLSWHPRNSSGIKQLNIDPENIWLPDTVLYNTVLEENEVGGNLGKMYTKVVLYHTGDIQWTASAILKTHCDINIRYFPFDSHHCELKFTSWTYPTSQVVLNRVVGRIVMDTANYENNSVWKLQNTSIDSVPKIYSCCDEPFSIITFHVYVARRSLFYLLNLIFPVSVITLLSVLSFLLPAESGERISLVVTLLLAIMVIMFIVAELTPATNEEIPLLSLYFIVSMIDMVILMITVCYVNKLYHKEGSDGTIGCWTRKIILDKLSYIVGVQCRPESDGPRANQMIESKISERSGCSKDLHLIDRVNPEVERSGVTDDMINGNKVRKVTMEYADMFEHKICEQLSQKIDKLVQKVENMKIDDSQKAEWRVVAMTIDRCLLMFFLINFIATLIGVFSLSPGYVA